MAGINCCYSAIKFVLRDLNLTTGNGSNLLSTYLSFQIKMPSFLWK